MVKRSGMIAVMRGGWYVELEGRRSGSRNFRGVPRENKLGNSTESRSCVPFSG